MADVNEEQAPASVEADVAGKLDRLTEKVQLLQELFVKRVKDDSVQKEAFNALHAELQQYKGDAVRASQKPILKGLVLIYDAACRMLESLPASKGTDAVETLAEEIVELLHRHDVEIMTEEPERFDAKIQMAIRTEPAAAEEEDQRVAQVVRQGFRWGQQILRPQEVIVKVYKKS